MKSRLLTVALFGCALTAAAYADQIVLKNGDRLTGTITTFDGKTLSMKTDALGVVGIDWNAIQQVTSERQLHLKASDGQTAVGAVTTVGDTFQVATRSGAVELPKTNIVSIEEQKAYEQSQHPKLRENWEGGGTVGFALTRGNSETTNLALAFNADRKTLHDKLTLYANTVYAANDAPGAIPKTSANAQQGGIRYDRDINGRLFGFGAADFQADALQSLNLRSVLGGGLGVHIVKREATTLDLLAGGNYTHESYVALARNFGAATLGDEFKHTLHGNTVVTQSFYFFPNLSDTGEYRTTLNFGTVTKLSKWFGWQNTFSDIYVSNPPLGKKKTDLIFTSGLNISLLHSEAQ